jgi:hypothetical protein
MEEPELALISEDSIRQALSAARARVTQAELDRAELDRVIAAAREEGRLLERLLALRRGPGSDGATDGRLDNASLNEEPRAGADPGPNVARSKKPPAVQAVIDELGMSGRPLHISELMRLLQTRGVPIPGSGMQANVIAHLRRDPRIVRTSRGMYALTAWDLGSVQGSRQVRQRRKRLRATAATEK